MPFFLKKLLSSVISDSLFEEGNSRLYTPSSCSEDESPVPWETALALSIASCSDSDALASNEDGLSEANDFGDTSVPTIDRAGSKAACIADSMAIVSNGLSFTLDYRSLLPMVSQISKYHRDVLWKDLPRANTSVVRNILDSISSLTDIEHMSSLVSENRFKPFHLDELGALPFPEKTAPDLPRFLGLVLGAIQTHIISENPDKGGADIRFNVVHRLYVPGAYSRSCMNVGWHQDNYDPRQNALAFPGFRVDYTFVVELEVRPVASVRTLKLKKLDPRKSVQSELMMMLSFRPDSGMAYAYEMGKGLGFNNQAHLHSVDFDGVNSREILILHASVGDGCA